MPGGNKPSVYIEQLYREMFSVLYRYALKILQNPSLAEEAVQNTFCIACEKEEKLLLSANPKGWIMNVLKNVIRSSLRARAKLAVNVINILEENNAEVAITDEINVDILYSDISQTEDFRLLKQLALSNSSLLDISDELGIPFEVCKKRVQRARKRLQKKISN